MCRTGDINIGGVRDGNVKVAGREIVESNVKSSVESSEKSSVDSSYGIGNLGAARTYIIGTCIIAVVVFVVVRYISQWYSEDNADGRGDDDDLEDMCEYKGRDVDVLLASKKDYEKHLSKRNSIYQITNKPKGNVLIVNNTKFPVWGAGMNIPSGEREGMLIRKLFERLGCKVKEANNETAAEMRNELERFAGNPCHNDADFAVVFILSHGARIDGDDVFYGTDGLSVKVSYAIELFENDKCTSLKNKPKLFFFEFCRKEPAPTADAENNLAEGSSYPDGDLPSPTDMLSRHVTPPRDPNQCTTRGDMLLTFATLKGDLSNNRYFTNAMLNVFSNKSKKKNIIEMLNEVKRGMYRENHNQMCWQMADMRKVKFTKKFYFFPGFPRARARNPWVSFKYWVTDTFL